VIKALLFVLVLAVPAQPAFAQGRGAAAGSGLPSGIDGPRTIPQQFASKLKLDKTQSPAVDEILSAAASEAAPHVQQMLLARQRMLNAARASVPEEVKAAQDAYAAAAATVAGVEASAFAKVYALLKPNQQKDAPEAFILMAGLFSSPAAGGGGRGGR
jgi:hypothetical protein